jgi:signal transduction histidine kinase
MNDPDASHQPRGLQAAWLQLLALLAFGGLSYGSLKFAGEIENHVSPLWPASGLAMAILFFGGRKYWPAIFLGSLISNGIITSRDFPDIRAWQVWMPALGIATGAVIEAIAAAWLLKKRAGGQDFCLSGGHANAFVLFVAIGAALISALIGPSALLLGGIFPPERWAMVALTWFVGDATGILIFGAAFIFPWRTIHFASLREEWLEILLLFLALGLVGGTMTGMYQHPFLTEWPRAYMILPVILWAVFRFGHLGTLLTLILTTVFSVTGAVFGHAVFPSTQPGYDLLFLQLFLLILSSVAWAVCGRVNELQILTNRLEDIVASRVVSQRDLLRRREDRITVLAHDLQVPLIGIRNLVQLLLQSGRQASDSEKSRKLLNVVGEASEQALALADRLLSNDEIRHLEPAPEPVDWVELLRSVSRRASLLEVSRELRFAIQCDESGIEGSVDRTVILQVLENLCHNAAKVSPHGGSVTLGLHQEGEAVVITVADQGPGFPSQEIPTLFTKTGFRQRIRTLPESTGLGLFIIGKSVRDLGGTISCQSLEGQGATFTIRLPRHSI